MEHDLYGAQKKVCKMLRNRKKSVNESVQTTKITTDPYNRSEKEEEEALNDYTILSEEIQKTIDKLKYCKTPGTDEIQNKLIKYGGRPHTEQLNTLFNKIVKHKNIPPNKRRVY